MTIIDRLLELVNRARVRAQEERQTWNAFEAWLEELFPFLK